MGFGPTTTPTRSPIAFDGKGDGRLWWDSGLEQNPEGMQRVPKMLVDLETQEGETALALFPSGIRRVLVDDPGRELVLEHYAQLRGPVLGKTIGVHLVTEQRSDGLIVCELIPSNGACDPKVAGSWPGCLRFRKIRLRLLTQGWASTGCDLGEPGDWYFGIGTAVSRRFVLYRRSDAGAAERATELLNRTGLAIPNPFPGLGPGAHVLPRSLEERWARLWTNVEKRGPFWPDTAVQNGYGAGGDRIWPVGGFECSESAARSYAEDVTRVLSRQGCARYHETTGRTITGGDWPRDLPGGYGLYDNRWSVDPWLWDSRQGTVVGMFGWNRGNNPPSWAFPREVNPGPCVTRADTLKTWGHDAAHLVRVRAIAVPAWYLCRSWAARKLLEWSAHDVLTSWSLLTLSAKLENARQHPGDGAEYPRELAWVYGSVADLLSVTPRGKEREPIEAWRAIALEYQAETILPNGFPRSGFPTSSDNGVPWNVDGLSLDLTACAWFQLGLWACGLFDLWTAGEGTEGHLTDLTRKDVSAQVAECLEALLVGSFMIGGSPPSYAGVARKTPASGGYFLPELPVTEGSKIPSYGTGQGSGHAVHDYSHLAIARRLAGEGELIAGHRMQVFLSALGPTSTITLEDARAWWRAHPDPWNVIPAEYLTL